MKTRKYAAPRSEWMKNPKPGNSYGSEISAKQLQSDVFYPNLSKNSKNHPEYSQ